jgi:hypothetical protein
MCDPFGCSAVAIVAPQLTLSDGEVWYIHEVDCTATDILFNKIGEVDD